MNRLSLAGLVAFAVASATLLVADPPVNLQASSPGVQQVGNINVSGRILAGSVSTTNSSTSAQAFAGTATATNGATFGGVFKSSSASGTGVRGVATATSGGANGGTFQTSAPTGAGVRGFATSASGVNYGVYGKAVSPSGFGLYAEGNLHATGILSGNGSGLSMVNASHLGGYSAGEYLRLVPMPLVLNGSQLTPTISASNTYPNTSAIRGMTTGNYSYGIFGIVNSGAAAGSGVYGEANNDTGIAVSGFASIGFGGANFGGYFTSAGSQGQGVHAVNSSSSGTTYGVVGEVFSSSGYGVYSLGKTGASGTKSFRIDHPFDPENKYLLHYSSEGPEPLNVYTGNIRTDSNGYATVELPTYFSDINRDPRYTLTVIDGSDDFVLAKVAREIADNRFVIRTSKPGVKVSWRVESVRNDRWVRAHGAPVEEDKVGLEKGTYQHPELYGMAQEARVSYRKPAPQPPLASSSKPRSR